MIISNPVLFEEAAKEMLPHAGHKLAITTAGGDFAPEMITVSCDDCHQSLLEFTPEREGSRWANLDLVRYEGRYDSERDVYSVEVFKPGRAPYPLQERQDIVNHSPTGIAWGYGGSGPAQCSLAILMDYFGETDLVRRLYQEFKFRVIAKLPRDENWSLTGTQIERVTDQLKLA